VVVATSGGVSIKITTTMEKERLAFNFFKSYYEVYKMLPTPEAKAEFIYALCEKQFFGIDPDIDAIEEKKFNFRSALVSLGVSNNLVKDWLQVRKTKKAANTETAFNALKKEIQKSGLSAEKCLLLAVENSWAGFKAEYAKNQTNNQHRKAHQSESQNYTFNI
jgi:hypothetical protein